MDKIPCQIFKKRQSESIPSTATSWLGEHLQNVVILLQMMKKHQLLVKPAQSLNPKIKINEKYSNFIFQTDTENLDQMDVQTKDIHQANKVSQNIFRVFNITIIRM